MQPDPSERKDIVGPRRIVRRLNIVDEPRFSICTMVTDWNEYALMRSSFIARGFTEQDCEYFVIDNSEGNVADGFVSVNEFLNISRGDLVILCHQDVLLLDDDRTVLEDRLAVIGEQDPHWALAGNAGVTEDGWPYNCVSDPNHRMQIIGKSLPQRVVSLDENFIVVRREANLAVSRDLTGFHHYGVDLCIVADILGWNIYVIDFLLRHNSGGNTDHRYFDSRDRLQTKYRRAFRKRWMPLVTLYPVFLGGSQRRIRIARLVRQARKLLGLTPRDRALYADERFHPLPRHLEAVKKYEERPGGEA